jgi:hypothetical protein
VPRCRWWAIARARTTPEGLVYTVAARGTYVAKLDGKTQ